MIVHALQKGDYNVDKMISALEGWKFLAPEGLPGDPAAGSRDAAADVPCRACDEERHLVANVLGTASPYETAPPLVR